jgi:hypothetical protein
MGEQQSLAALHKMAQNEFRSKERAHCCRVSSKNATGLDVAGGQPIPVIWCDNAVFVT